MAENKPENELTCKDIEPGAVITEPGSACQDKTGDWRTKRPVFDKEKCSKCGMCFLFCPEGCIKQTEEGYFMPDLEYCKGCGICAEECPRKAILMEEEKEK